MCAWRRGGAPTHASAPICAGAPSPRTTCPCRTAVGSCGAPAPKPSSRVQPPGTAGAPRPRATRRAGRARTTRSIGGPAACRGGAPAARADSTGGPSAHDTFNWSAGAELGPATSPIRLGARGGQLPFGIGKAPTEVGYSAGLGRSFSQGRGRLDVGIERLQRKGTGLTERVWTLLLGLTVRP